MLCKHPLRRLSQLSVYATLWLVNLSGCVSTPTQSGSPQPGSPAATTAGADDRPLVVATNSVICDLTHQLAAATVNLKCLIEGGVDAHEYKPKPEDSKAIEQAALILYGGYNFEPELIRLITASSNSAPKIPVNEVAVPQPQQFEEDGKTEADPHVFHSAAHGARLAIVISKQLIKLQPTQASLYATNTRKVTDELTQIDTWIKAEIATIPVRQRKLVTTHDALGYYSNAYGIPVVGALQGLNTDEKATPTRVKALVLDIQTAKVPTIFAEASINPKLIEAVAREATVKVADRPLFTDGLGEKGSAGDTYQKMLLANTQVIVEGLGGKFTPFQVQ